ncbi:MAG: FUSC family protein, partial [Rhodanobacter sp.]
WERGRARAALAVMLDAYASYLRALAQPEQRNAHRDARTAARTARTNAQASLDRMRSEPATPPHLLELASALFANGNRLARTAMTMEALHDDHEHLPGQAQLSAFVAQAGATLHEIAAALREQRAIGPCPDLRALQRDLAILLQGTGDRETVRSVERICDRLTDNVNTLGHVVGRAPLDQADIPGRAVIHR